MTVRHIMVIGADPADASTIDPATAEVHIIDRDLPFQDALREAYSTAGQHPPAETAFLIPCDDQRILNVANKLHAKGHQVVLHSTNGVMPATDLPVVLISMFPQQVYDILGLVPKATRVVDDMLDGYDDPGTEPGADEPLVFVVNAEYDDDADDEDFTLAAAPPPPGYIPAPQPEDVPEPEPSWPDGQPDVPTGVAPPPPRLAVAPEPATAPVAPWEQPAPVAPVAPVPVQPQPAPIPEPVAAPVAPWETPAPEPAPLPQPAPTAHAPQPDYDYPPAAPLIDAVPAPMATAPPAPVALPYEPQTVGVPTGAAPWAPPPGAPIVPSYADAPELHSIPAYKTTAEIYTFAVPKGGTGKCVAHDSMVTDPVTGLRRTIAEVYADPDTNTVLSFDGRFITSMPIAEKHNTGVLPLLKVGFASGRSVKTTPWHPFLMPEGWRRADEIIVGETAATPSRLPFPTSPHPLDDAELDLLAVLMAEGNTTKSVTRFSTGDNDILELMTSAATALGIDVVPQPTRQYDYALVGGDHVDTDHGTCGCGCGAPTRAAVHSSSAHRWTAGEPIHCVPGHRPPNTTLRCLRRDHGLVGVKATDKVMPDAIFQIPEHQLARFMAVFWMCDGYVDTRQGHPEVTLASRALSEAVQHLLLRFGIQSALAYKKASYVTDDGERREFDAWRVTVYSTSVETFADRIPLWGAKRDTLTAGIELRKVTGRNPNVGSPSLSPALKADLVSHRLGKGAREAARAMGWDVDRYESISPSMVLAHKATKNGHQHLSLGGLRAYCEAYGLEAEHAWVYDSELFWDEVVSIEELAPEQCYDFTVDGTHCFVADDILVHNTGLSLLFANTLAEGIQTGFDPRDPALPKVVWIDGNMQQADGRYNIGVQPAHTIMDLAQAPFDESNIMNYLTPPDPSAGRFMWVLAGPSSKAKADPSVVTPELYRRVAETLAKLFKYVVVDTPEARVYDPQLAEFGVPIADWLMVPVTPDRGVLDGTKEWLDVIQAPKYARGYDYDSNRVRIILNMARKDVGYGEAEILTEMGRWAYAGEVPESIEWRRAKAEYCLPFGDRKLKAALRNIIYAVTNNPAFHDEPRRGFLAGLGLRRNA